MDNENKSPPSSPGSSSASASPSQDALDSSSVRDLAAALHGLATRLDDIRHAASNEKNRTEWRDQQMTAALNRLTVAHRELAASIDKAVRLNREVVRSQHQVVEVAAKKLDESVKIVTQGVDSDEITARHVKVRWATLMKWAPIIAKAGAAIATGLAAAYGFFKAFLQRFND